MRVDNNSVARGGCVVKRLMVRKYRFLSGLLGFMLLAGSVQAQQVEAEGTAPITGPVGVAKRMAMQDAIRQALIQANTQVTSTTVMSSRGVVTDTVRYRARGRVTNVVVMDEWTDESNYYVRIRAQVPDPDTVALSTPSTRQMPGSSRSPLSAEDVMNAPTRMTRGSATEDHSPEMVPAQTYSSDAAAHYRRKLAITQFHVVDRTHIADLPNVEVELSRDLKRRLDASGQVRTVDASQYLVPLNGDDLVSQRRILGALPSTQDAGQLAIEFAESLSVQYVVTGVIRDMSISKHRFGSRVRHLELELVVHDGITGVEVARHQISESAEDSGIFKPKIDAPLLNEKFFASPFGRKVNRSLDKLANLLTSDLSNQPFTARVIRTEGTQVFFDAGGLANIREGDVLSTYQLAPATLNDLPGQRSLGFQEKPTSSMVVTQVQRLFSVGELDSQTARLSPGDVIRFDP